MGFNPSGGGISSADDVAVSNPAAGQTLTYDSGVSLWRNTNLAAVATAGTYVSLTGRPTIPTTAVEVGAVPLGGGTGKVWLGGATRPTGMAVGDYWVHDA